MPYTNKTARYEQSYEEDRGTSFGFFELVVLLAMVPVAWYVDAVYNHGHGAAAVLAAIGF